MHTLRKTDQRFGFNRVKQKKMTEGQTDME